MFFELLWRGGFGSAFSWQNTLLRAAPLILTALCVAIPARAGLIIIGGEGALVLGGLAGSRDGIAYRPSRLRPLVLSLMALASMVGRRVVDRPGRHHALSARRQRNHCQPVDVLYRHRLDRISSSKVRCAIRPRRTSPRPPPSAKPTGWGHSRHGRALGPGGRHRGWPLCLAISDQPDDLWLCRCASPAAICAPPAPRACRSAC